VEHLAWPVRSRQLPHEIAVFGSVRRPVQMAVDVERGELDRPAETGVAPERAADVQPDHERRPGRLGPLATASTPRRSARAQVPRRDAHDAPPSTVWVFASARTLWFRAGSGAPIRTTHEVLRRDGEGPTGRGRCVMRRRVAALALALSVVACSPSQTGRDARSTLVIGLDISGSFRRTPVSAGRIEFASLYIYGHLTGSADCSRTRRSSWGAGGERTGQAKVFHPSRIFRGRRPAQIATDLRGVVPARRPDHRLQRVLPARRLHVKRNNLCCWRPSTSCCFPTASRTIRGPAGFRSTIAQAPRP